MLQRLGDGRKRGPSHDVCWSNHDDVTPSLSALWVGGGDGDGELAELLWWLLLVDKAMPYCHLSWLTGDLHCGDARRRRGGRAWRRRLVIHRIARRRSVAAVEAEFAAISMLICGSRSAIEGP